MNDTATPLPTREDWDQIAAMADALGAGRTGSRVTFEYPGYIDIGLADGCHLTVGIDGYGRTGTTQYETNPGGL